MARLESAPRQLSTTIHVRHRFRFTATAAAITVLTQWGLSTLLSVCYTTATAARGLFYAVRIREIEIWSPVPSIGATQSCAVRWSGGTLGSDANVSDTSMNVSEPAHVRSSPPARTTAQYWCNNDLAQTVLCAINYGAGAVIDVELDLILANSSQTIITAIAAGTDGFQYALPLDLSYAGTHNLLPVGLQYTY